MRKLTLKKTTDVNLAPGKENSSGVHELYSYKSKAYGG